jgi:predicted DNA-binding ribbon-helix-helix protein
VIRANVKRSFAIAGHRTSVALEPEFWRELEAMAGASAKTLPQMIAQIDAGRDKTQPLSSALRVAVLKWLATQK